MAATSPTAARSAARAAARPAPRPTRRRKVTRPPQPRIPEDFFDSEAHDLLKTLLIDGVKHWQEEGQPAHFLYDSDSAPRWGDNVLMPCSGTTIRIMRLTTLSRCLGMDLERGLRLLTLTWTKDNRTTEGNHDVEEWRRGLTGCLWRLGQLYREAKRRKGAEAARRFLADAMTSLHDEGHALCRNFAIVDQLRHYDAWETDFSSLFAQHL